MCERAYCVNIKSYDSSDKSFLLLLFASVLMMAGMKLITVLYFVCLPRTRDLEFLAASGIL